MIRGNNVVSKTTGHRSSRSTQGPQLISIKRNQSPLFATYRKRVHFPAIIVTFFRSLNVVKLHNFHRPPISVDKSPRIIPYEINEPAMRKREHVENASTTGKSIASIKVNGNVIYLRKKCKRAIRMDYRAHLTAVYFAALKLSFENI